MAKKKKIEEKIKDLDQIIEMFESGEVGLEEGVEHFKKGKKIIKEIKNELESIELEIKQIKE
ncbi:exodeoxyribonuclease VII small subunit [Candidatus Dojkabacteria bacterium]|nr:exodeoxyribonuclease VII small subunit [Candidatus Dojkabacteria bacterium]